MTFVHSRRIVAYAAADYFLADLDFLGVLPPPFFLGVLKSLSQTSHTQRPEGKQDSTSYKSHIKSYVQELQRERVQSRCDGGWMGPHR